MNPRTPPSLRQSSRQDTLPLPCRFKDAALEAVALERSSHFFKVHNDFPFYNKKEA